MKVRWTSILPCLLWAVSALFCSSQAAAQTWTLKWSDEFSGAVNTFPDSANWGYEYGNLNVNNELEYYCGPPRDPNNQSPCTNNPNVFMDGTGHLEIQAIRVGSGTAAGSNSWTSTRMNSSGKQQFTFGRIEASMKLPTGAGLWPAFWALGTNISQVGWPASGEIDFMENVPSPPSQLGPTKISSTLHGGASSSSCYCGGNGLTGIFTFPTGDVTSFHTYGGIWSPFMVQFYVDDPSNVFEVRTANDIPANQTWDFNHPFYLLLNLAVGGTGSWPGPPDNNTPDPAPMLVDYVRYYQASAVPAPPNLGTPNAITIKAGAVSGNTTTVNLTGVNADGRVYLNCSTNAPKASCAISTTDPLSKYTVNFSGSTTASATVTLTTTANPQNSGAVVKPGRNSSGSPLSRLASFLFLGICGVVFTKRPSRRWRHSVISICALVMILTVGCGGGSATGGGNGGGGGNTASGTTPGTYQITVNAYTESNISTTTPPAPDATVQIPVTVQ